MNEKQNYYFEKLPLVCEMTDCFERKPAIGNVSLEPYAVKVFRY